MSVMSSLKLSIASFLIITFFGLVSCSGEDINKQEINGQTKNKTLQELVKNVTDSRISRALLSHPRAPAFTLRRRQPIKIRARADHFPLRTQIRRVHNSLPNAQPKQQNMRFGYESLKSSKYIPPPKGANLPFPNTGKGTPYRPQLLEEHPNSIHVPAMSQQYIHNFKASPAFNGQVVVHPAVQAEKQKPTKAQQDNSYPKYVIPAVAAASFHSHTLKQQHQQQHLSLLNYPDFKQHPIPDHEKMQQHNEMHEKYLQQQKFLMHNNPNAHRQQLPEINVHLHPQTQQNNALEQPLQYLPQAQQQQQQQPSIPLQVNGKTHNINKVAFPAAASAPPKMYSVYEEDDTVELQNKNYQTAPIQELDKKAQDYLRFMNTDEYFLPKKEPNYKKIDNESDERQYNVLKTQVQHLHSLQQSQAPTSYQQPLAQQTAHQQHVYTPPYSSAQGTQYSNRLYSDASDVSAYNQVGPVSRLFYQQYPSTAASASSAVVRTSYQAGYNHNQFGKYTTATPSTIVISTQSPVVYTQLRHKTTAYRTPEPLRFEFTERDAVVGGYAYTNAPQEQLRYKELTSNSVTPIVPKNVISSTTSSWKIQHYLNDKQAIKPIVEEVEDDPEDDDDMQDSRTHIFGRQPVNSNKSNAKKSSSTTEAPPSEQKDTEEYCERICAIVEDENQEIVCGSDGYMYTSEAQMECYASCLHIDVTIQGKGSCSTR